MVLWENVIFHLREAQTINSSVCLLHLVVVITIKMIADSFCCLRGRLCCLKENYITHHLMSSLCLGKNVTVKSFLTIFELVPKLIQTGPQRISSLQN